MLCIRFPFKNFWYGYYTAKLAEKQAETLDSLRKTAFFPENRALFFKKNRFFPCLFPRYGLLYRNLNKRGNQLKIKT